MIKIHDISVLVHNDMVIWPGLIPLQLSSHQRMTNGDRVNVSNMSSCVHVGTHVDAPFHHFSEGKTIDEIPVERYFGLAYVLDLSHVDKCIKESNLREKIGREIDFDILVLKTKNSVSLPTWERFDEDYIYIDGSGADFLVETGIKAVVFDHLGVEGYKNSTFPTHRTLLGNADIAIIEGVNLKEVGEGYYLFSGAPIKLKDSDGAPCRAFLIEDTSGALYKTWRMVR